MWGTVCDSAESERVELVFKDDDGTVVSSVAARVRFRHSPLPMSLFPFDATEAIACELSSRPRKIAATILERRWQLQFGAEFQWRWVAHCQLGQGTQPQQGQSLQSRSPRGGG